ncbi:helix-turn-helix domain-containing protein [Aliarcobacter lanthieri]|uniref:helix-turn-helix domain-containing protein n=1 Tax=Aliarcobacter lanthieri TaxID=1355374 RepID=UPI003AADABB3
MRSRKTKSQKEQIKEWLEDGLDIDFWKAVEHFKCRSLPQRIEELRKEGLNIKTKYEDGSRCAIYFLVKEKDAK